MPTVYLETTIPSYLAARPSRDLIIAAHQQITHEWWRNAGDRFDLYISEAVLAEIRAGDPDAAARRLAIMDGLPLLALNEDVGLSSMRITNGSDWGSMHGQICLIWPSL